MKNLDKKYVVVTAVASYRIRYAIPMDELQSLNPNHPVESAWALDSVTCEEVEEFSQQWLGEHIIDHEVVSEEQILQLFNKDNYYSVDLPDKEKLARIRNWQIKK